MKNNLNSEILDRMREDINLQKAALYDMLKNKEKLEIHIKKQQEVLDGMEREYNKIEEELDN